MKYGDLINFNPIESVIELKSAGDDKKAKELVSSYVMSDEMADKLDYSLLSQLQLDEIIDNKGVLLVGNYGTGKSHLMSLISSVASNKDLLGDIKNKKFAEHMKALAGKFEVLRIELGGVENNLRNMIIKDIETDLSHRGINFKFPDSTSITSHKPSLEAMMSAFEEKYNNKGYLLVVDELLDYLRTRKEHELMLDLGFLRELGEFIKTSRFRLICGVQEQLFNNPRFSFVSDTMSKIRDRFEQMIIRKEDTAYVVSERILNKTKEQKSKIREHLLPFCPLYSEMSERIEDYIELFPIHPAYIEVFNKVHIAENRHVLKTISTTIYHLLDKEVAKEKPGIFSFDSYWGFIKDNYARRSEDDIRKVLEISEVLEDKIAKTFPKKQYKALALQIINGLSVHRLTTGGIDVRLGLTAENLKDDLCLFIENMPEEEPEFLLSIIKIVLKEIMTLVSGQFIEYNKDNEQYFLDPDKDIDYDAKIEEKSNSLQDGSLNRYYYSIVYDLLEWNEDKAVPNYEIYEYQLNWDSRNVFRRGYLFLGIPNDRSTAQPPRDYYIYVLPPFGDIKYDDDKNDDEVFFKLKVDEEFHNNMMLFSAAKELQNLASDQSTKKIYADRAKIYEKNIKKWLRDNKNTSYKVIFKGISKQLIQLTKGKTKESEFKDTIDIASSICLEEHFNKLYPDFPAFKLKITKNNYGEIVSRAIKYFAGQKTNDSEAFLQSFNLIDDGKINIENSKYAMHFVKLLSKLPQQGVLNRSEILEEKSEELIDKRFKINNEYFIVIYLSLVYAGYANMAIKDLTITPSNMDKLMTTAILSLYEFKYLAKPKEAAIAELKKLLNILDLPKGLAISNKELEKGLDKILDKTTEIAQTALKYKNFLNNEPRLWGELLFPEHIKQAYEPKINYVLSEFSNFRNKYNTVAKINNLNLTMAQLDEIEEGIDYIRILKEYEKFKIETQNTVNYIINIENSETPEPLNKKIESAKKNFFEIRDNIKDKKDGEKAIRQLGDILKPIKREYMEYYYEIHSKARLGVKDSKRKGQLMNSKTLAKLRKLTEIKGIFQKNKLELLERQLALLQICFELSPADLKDNHVCTKCKFTLSKENPVVEGRLDFIEDNLDKLLEDWTSALLSAMDDSLIWGNKKLLTKKQQELIDEFIASKELPETVDTYFINTFNTLFDKLDKVDIDVLDLIRTVQNMGPSTVKDLKNRLLTYIDEQVKDKDLEKVRIIIKSDNKNEFVVWEENEVSGGDN